MKMMIRMTRSKHPKIKDATLYGKVFRKRRLSKSGELLKLEVKTKREDS